MTNTHTDSTSELFCLLVEARERGRALKLESEERVFTTPNPASSRRRCQPRRHPSRRCLERHRNPCRPCRPCQAYQACHPCPRNHHRPFATSFSPSHESCHLLPPIRLRPANSRSRL